MLVWSGLNWVGFGRLLWFVGLVWLKSGRVGKAALGRRGVGSSRSGCFGLGWFVVGGSVIFFVREFALWWLGLGCLGSSGLSVVGLA